MGSNRRSPRSAWIAPVLIWFSLALYGCVEVDVLDTTPEVATPQPISSEAPPADGERNLAVLAVEFDPALDYRNLMILREQVTLLVAVENTGSRTERQVTVAAKLTSPEDPDLLLDQQAVVESIAPGEVQVVRFPRLEPIPTHWHYRLEVAVEALDGERSLGDNRKAFDIQIHRQ